MLEPLDAGARMVGKIPEMRRIERQGIREMGGLELVGLWGRENASRREVQSQWIHGYLFCCCGLLLLLL